MPRAGLLGGVAAAAFLVVLLASAPASLLSRLAPAGLRLADPQGSLWAGEASAVTIGTLHLGHTTWELSPWQVLLGRLAGQLDAALPGGFARGEFAAGLGGSVRLTNFSVASPVPAIVAATGLSLPVTGGQVAVEVAELQIVDGWPRRAIGEIRVGEVALIFRNGQPVRNQLASFSLQFDAASVPESGLIEGKLADSGGPLEVAGVLELLPPASYELTGRAAARANAPQELAQALVMLGPESADGGREFSFAGSF